MFFYKKIMLAIPFLYVTIIFGETIESPEIEVYKQEVQTEKTLENKNKNGFYFGLEASLGEMKVWQKTLENLSTKSGGLAFNGGLKLGYQHFFDENQMHGLRLGGFLYGGLPLVLEAYAQNENLKSVFVPFKFGLELAYLVDFFNRGRHSVGMSFGIGYELNTVFMKSRKTLDPKDKSQEEIHLNKFYPVIALHYEYHHNQFEIGVRFGGLIESVKEGIENQYTMNMPFDGVSYILSDSASYVFVGYSYRF